MVHACRAAGQAVQHRLPGPHRSGAEQRGFQQVGAASNSAAHQRWNLNGHRTDHGGQQLGDGRQGVKRAPAVVVDDDTGHAVLYRQKRVLSVCDAFEQPRQVGDRVPPDDVVLNGRLEQEVAKQGAPAGQQVLGQLHAATRQVDGLELGSVPVASAPSAAARKAEGAATLSTSASKPAATTGAERTLDHSAGSAETTRRCDRRRPASAEPHPLAAGWIGSSAPRRRPGRRRPRRWAVRHADTPPTGRPLAPQTAGVSACAPAWRRGCKPAISRSTRWEGWKRCHARAFFPRVLSSAAPPSKEPSTCGFRAWRARSLRTTRLATPSGMWLLGGCLDAALGAALGSAGQALGRPKAGPAASGGDRKPTAA